MITFARKKNLSLFKTMLMMKSKLIWMLFFACIMGMGITSCADKEEGESDEDWELRNTINGPAWRVYMVKDASGNWIDSLPLWFEVKFSASKHNFKSEKFYYVNGIGDDATRETYKESDNTQYTISGNVIEGTVNNNKYFRITLSDKVTYEMKGTLYFYKENKSFEVLMMR